MERRFNTVVVGYNTETGHAALKISKSQGADPGRRIPLSSVETQTSSATFEFTVDGQAFTTRQHELTPVQIMKIAGIDPTTHFLVEIRGREQISFEGKPDTEIKMRQHMVFITASLGPTPVS